MAEPNPDHCALTHRCWPASELFDKAGRLLRELQLPDFRKYGVQEHDGFTHQALGFIDQHAQDPPEIESASAGGTPG